MKRSIIKLILVVIAILLVLFILFALQDTNNESVRDLLGDADSLERHLEMNRHEKLKAVKDNPGNILTEFISDGCSGGLTVGWEFLAGKVHKFQNTHGTVPPWQTCCETHDLAYHSAGLRTDTADMSFETRRKADLELKECVLKIGIQRSPVLTKEYNVSDTELTEIYQGIGNLMYGAVRLGGMPCTDLPWRWGYGWPECK
jgi:hypothetical protein